MGRLGIKTIIIIFLILSLLAVAEELADPEKNWGLWTNAQKIECINTLNCREDMAHTQIVQVLNNHSIDIKADTMIVLSKEKKITPVEFFFHHNYMWENFPNSIYTKEMVRRWGEVPKEYREYCTTHYTKKSMNNFMSGGNIKDLISFNGINWDEGWDGFMRFLEILLGGDDVILIDQLPSEVIKEALQGFGYEGINSIELNGQPTVLGDEELIIDGTIIDLETFKEGSYDIVAYPDGALNISGNIIKDADYIAALDGNGLFVNNSEYWDYKSITIVNGINVIFQDNGFDILQANSVIQNSSFTTAVINYSMSFDNPDSFFVDFADMIWIDGITFFDVEKTGFDVFTNSVKASPDEGTKLKIMDECMGNSTFTPVDDEGSIKIIKHTCMNATIEHGVFEFNSTSFSEKIIANSTAIIILNTLSGGSNLSNGYGVTSIEITPPGTYYYNDLNILKDFGINIPEYGFLYRLVIRKDEVQHFDDYDGIVDFPQSTIKLNGMANYMRHQFDGNGILKGLDFKNVYTSKNQNNNMRAELDGNFVMVNKLFVENKDFDCGSESILAEVFNNNYHIVEICDPIANKAKRYAGFKHDNPDVIGAYTSFFGSARSPITFYNNAFTIYNQKTASMLVSSDIAKSAYKKEMDPYRLNFNCDKYDVFFDDNSGTIYSWYLK